MSVSAYPLSWPEAFPRCRVREKGSFKTSLAGALGNVETSLKRFGSDSHKSVSNIVLSSNVTLGVSRPQDPGIAVWFTWDGLQVCIPVDRYETPEANLQAIHHVIEARRVELRHGTLALVRATMTGFIALPAPGGSEAWWVVLGVSKSASIDEAETAYRFLARKNHPDVPGGSEGRMSDINAAIARARKELT